MKNKFKGRIKTVKGGGITRSGKSQKACVPGSDPVRHAMTT
jgi:hypothetical protein